MPTALLSIRHKVTIAVIALYFFMAAGVAGSYYFMYQLEDKIAYLEELSKLEESILEIRRFEKNYFLYDDQKSLATVLYHIDRVKELLKKNVPKIESLSSHEKVNGFMADLAEYERLLQSCWAARVGEECQKSSETRAEQEARIRSLGSRISDFAEGLARQKRQSIRQTMRTAVQIQMLVFAVVAFGFTVHGAFLVTKVIKPLRRLEKSTESIAKGQFKPIHDLPPEKEIREIFDSFNRMAEQLKIREEQLVQSKKLASLGTMLAGVAHEVNNPLSNISSSCEILMEELDHADPDWQKQLLKKVLEQVDKARGIVLNLLEFSRNKDFSKEWFELEPIIRKTLSLLHGQIPPQIQVDVEVEPRLKIYADKQRFQQAVMNLVSNAVQAIDGEGVVSIKARQATDGFVEVAIRDTGKGIKQEDLPKIFDPFFTTKDVGKGTGLGLFITHDIILRHGGSIQVDSEPGKGTTFLLKLPAQEVVNE
jgi:signal transduction histidine kinase